MEAQQRNIVAWGGNARNMSVKRIQNLFLNLTFKPESDGKQ
jgi:hypothetical protein